MAGYLGVVEIMLGGTVGEYANLLGACDIRPANNGEVRLHKDIIVKIGCVGFCCYLFSNNLNYGN